MDYFPKLYNIVRYYAHGNRNRIMKRNVTLEEAQKWCNDPTTRKLPVTSKIMTVSES